MYIACLDVGYSIHIHPTISGRNRKSKGKNKKDADASAAADGAIAAAAASAMSNEDAVDGTIAGTENGASSSSPDQESVP